MEICTCAKKAANTVATVNSSKWEMTHLFTYLALFGLELQFTPGCTLDSPEEIERHTRVGNLFLEILIT